MYLVVYSVTPINDGVVGHPQYHNTIYDGNCFSLGDYNALTKSLANKWKPCAAVVVHSFQKLDNPITTDVSFEGTPIVTEPING